MNYSILRRGLCVFALLIAGNAMAGDNTPPPATPPPEEPGTLFNANEFDLSFSGLFETGNIHLGTYQTPVYTTHTVNVAAPTTPAGPTSVITISLKRAFRTSIALKPLTATGGTVSSGDPTVTTTTRHIVQPTQVEHNAGGGSIEAAWFFTRYLGIAVEGDFLGGNPFTTQLTGDFIMRYPFEFGSQPVAGYSKDNAAGKDSKTVETTTPTWGIAPYVLVGGGSQWDGRAVGLADVGGGAELRFTKHWGVFSDVRWFVRNGAQHFTAVRAGVAYQF
jgi:hypothetical protein